MDKITMEMAEKLFNKIVVISHGLFDIEALKEDTIKSWQEEGLIEEVDYEKDAIDKLNSHGKWHDSDNVEYWHDEVHKVANSFKKAIAQLKEKLNNS